MSESSAKLPHEGPGAASTPDGEEVLTARLWVEDLHKEYLLGKNVIHVLRGVTEDFPNGHTSVIQGSSGSGKSTLLHVLGGLDAPNRGKVFWRGTPIYDWKPRQISDWRALTVGFIFQTFHLLPELSAIENVEMPALLARRGDPAISADLLTRVGLGHRLHHRPNEMSGGEQQRVAIARALRNDPDLLLADEPTGNLDSKTGHEVFDLLLALQQEKKKTLIVVTHDESIAARGQFRFRLTDGLLSQ